MVVVAMNTFYFCSVLAASAVVALWREGALIRPVPHAPHPPTDVLPPEPETAVFGRTLLRGTLTDEPASAGEAVPAHTRLRSVAAFAAPLRRGSRVGSTIVVAMLAGIAACAYLAEGVAISGGGWLLPCVGIPLIVALVNLLQPADG
ncbi:MAG: hypothetical protein U1E38_07625 [Rhodospirillales bacterium]